MEKNSMLVIGLVVGVLVGFGLGYMLNQSQIAQLQSDLSDTQSTLSDTQSALAASQSEVGLLQSELAEAQVNVSSLETQLSVSQASVTSLESQLAAKEADYSELSAEYDMLKSNVTSLVNSLEKKMELETQIIKMWVHYERGEAMEFSQTLFGLETYVDAVDDSELSSMWDDFLAHFSAGEYTEADEKLADLMERNSALIQNDLSELNTLLGS